MDTIRKPKKAKENGPFLQNHATKTRAPTCSSMFCGIYAADVEVPLCRLLSSSVPLGGPFLFPASPIVESWPCALVLGRLSLLTHPDKNPLDDASAAPRSSKAGDARSGVSGGSPVRLRSPVVGSGLRSHQFTEGA